MANDAKIQQVEELAAYSKQLGNFTESMAKNFATFNNVMMQKLEVLRKKRNKAEEIEAEAIREYTEAFKEYSYCPEEDREERKSLRVKLRKAEQKKLAAQRMKNVVKSQYGVAQGMVRAMLDDSKMFQNKLSNNITNGRNFLSKASVQLEQYKENAKKV